MREPWLVALSLAGAAIAPAASAAPVTPELEVRAVCEAPRGPGRVRCELELHAPAGARLAWSDVLVVSASSAARPLRSRLVAPPGADGVGRAALAVLATTTGVFPLVLRGRAVVCDGPAESARCQPLTREARFEVRVGA